MPSPLGVSVAKPGGLSGGAHREDGDRHRGSPAAQDAEFQIAPQTNVRVLRIGLSSSRQRIINGYTDYPLQKWSGERRFAGRS